MDAERFANICTELSANNRLRGDSTGIGTLGEKTLHRVVKEYYKAEGYQTECKIGTHVVDILGGGEIIEVQTRGFNRLRVKLDALLPEYKIRIVHPLPAVKWLLWIDEETGVVTKRRKSPKRGNIYSCFPELYRIKQHLTDANLSLTIVLVDLEEYRLLDGWSHDRKKGSTRFERIPLSLADELNIRTSIDYGKLIPPDLPSEFTSADFSKAATISRRQAQTALNVLSHVGAVERSGKRSQHILYRRGDDVGSEV